MTVMNVRRMVEDVNTCHSSAAIARAITLPHQWNAQSARGFKLLQEPPRGLCQPAEHLLTPKEGDRCPSRNLLLPILRHQLQSPRRLQSQSPKVILLKEPNHRLRSPWSLILLTKILSQLHQPLMIEQSKRISKVPTRPIKVLQLNANRSNPVMHA